MRRLVLVGAILASVIGFPIQGLAADANGNHESYTWVVGAVTPGAIAVAPDGSSIFMKGHGPMQAGPDKSAGGGGSYKTMSPSGAVTGSGSFTVTGVQGFVSYGSGAAQGFPPAFTGGEAKLKVTLTGTISADGVLTVTCLLGNPPGGKDESIALILGTGSGGEYTMPMEPSSTVFILVS